MYAVIGLFDEQTELLIKTIWRELQERSISFYAEEIVDRRPHMTIANHNNLDKLEFVNEMDKFYEDKPVVHFLLNSVGSFLNSGALYFAPAVTEQLTNLHSTHHQHFGKFNDIPDSLYAPGNWTPHCTIANRLSEQKLEEAFKYCLKRTANITGHIAEIALIELVDKRNVPVIYSKRLILV
ncbi:2'-5' RNA ligase family protein [Paenibacillus sp. GbtcB18]|uniref:2'-5' RNA ligase family protein n=1 Tax=Paenibacillus sp. GbtcB18 TaxID=2824763 RepID=UPI001C304983|nr:2'-5' RNA ligase family protein [Paenibacillus sp. GbtcB18]